jgi:hypothetical protein
MPRTIPYLLGMGKRTIASSRTHGPAVAGERAANDLAGQVPGAKTWMSSRPAAASSACDGQRSSRRRNTAVPRSPSEMSMAEGNTVMAGQCLRRLRRRVRRASQRTTPVAAAVDQWAHHSTGGPGPTTVVMPVDIGGRVLPLACAENQSETVALPDACFRLLTRTLTRLRDGVLADAATTLVHLVRWQAHPGTRHPLWAAATPPRRRVPDRRRRSGEGRRAATVAMSTGRHGVQIGRVGVATNTATVGRGLGLGGSLVHCGQCWAG